MVGMKRSDTAEKSNGTFVLKSKRSGGYLKILNHVDVTHVADKAAADVFDEAGEERLFDYFFTLDPRDYTTEYV